MAVPGKCYAPVSAQVAGTLTTKLARAAKVDYGRNHVSGRMVGWCRPVYIDFLRPVLQLELLFSSLLGGVFCLLS